MRVSLLRGPHAAEGPDIQGGAPRGVGHGLGLREK